MTCEAFKDQLVELSMGTLEATQRPEVLAHLKTGCLECKAYLAKTEQGVALLPLSLEPITPPASARDRLLKRVAGESGVSANPMRIGPAAAPLPRRFGIFPALAGGAIAAGIMGGIFWFASQGQRQQIALLQKQLDETRTAVDTFKASTQSKTEQLEASVQQTNLSMQRTNDSVQRTAEAVRQTMEAVRQASEAVEMIRSPGVQMVSLQGTEAQPKVKARAYWNAEKSVVHFYATDVAQAPAGKTYQFWMVTDKGAALPSSTFGSDQAANGVAIALPSTADKIVAFAVSQEPAGGSLTPTSIVAKGAIQ